MKFTKHPSADLLELYSRNRLTDSQLDGVEEHLLVCAECQEAVEKDDVWVPHFKSAGLELRREPNVSPPPFLARLWAVPRPVYAGAFAAVVLAVAVPVSLRQASGPRPAATIQLQTSRGAEGGMARSSAHRPLRVQLDARDMVAGASYRAEVVDRKGARLWSGAPVRQGDELAFDLHTGLRPGTYWVRLFEDDTPVREFGLELK